MNNPRHPAAALVVALLTLPSFFASQVYAQRPPSVTPRITVPQQQSNPDESIESLRAAAAGEKPRDAEVWFALGRALLLKGEATEARKSFSQAVKLQPRFVAARVNLAYALYLEGRLLDALREADQSRRLDIRNVDANYLTTALLLRYIRERHAQALAQAEEQLRQKPDSASAHLLKARALLGMTASGPELSPDFSRTPPPNDSKLAQARKDTSARFREAMVSLEQYTRLAPNDADAKFWQSQLEALRVYVHNDSLPESERTIFASSEVTSRLRVTYKPEAHYTQKARQARVEGIVRLRAVLTGDGKVDHILVVLPLSHGLIESAISAARKVRFEPATKNGQAVSQSVFLEYQFTIF